MKRLIIDSDILIEMSKSNTVTADLLSDYQMQGYQLCISIVTKFELVIGAINKKDLQVLLKFLSRFECLQLNANISMIADNLIVTHALSHGLKIADALIASSAIYYQADLISRNQKDFRYITALNLLSY